MTAPRFDHDGTYRHHHDDRTGEPIWWENAEQFGGERRHHVHWHRATPEAQTAGLDERIEQSIRPRPRTAEEQVTLPREEYVRMRAAANAAHLFMNMRPCPDCQLPWPEGYVHEGCSGMKKLKRWRHTGRMLVAPKFRTDHDPTPYARVGDDNRCQYCGDVIVEEVESPGLVASVAEPPENGERT